MEARDQAEGEAEAEAERVVFPLKAMGSPTPNRIHNQIPSRTDMRAGLLLGKDRVIMLVVAALLLGKVRVIILAVVGLPLGKVRVITLAVAGLLLGKDQVIILELAVAQRQASDQSQAGRDRTHLLVAQDQTQPMAPPTVQLRVPGREREKKQRKEKKSGKRGRQRRKERRTWRRE